MRDYYIALYPICKRVNRTCYRYWSIGEESIGNERIVHGASLISARSSVVSVRSSVVFVWSSVVSVLYS